MYFKDENWASYSNLKRTNCLLSDQKIKIQTETAPNYSMDIHINILTHKKPLNNLKSQF